VVLQVIIGVFNTRPGHWLPFHIDDAAEKYARPGAAKDSEWAALEFRRWRESHS
jgi:hypothetical protein